MKANLPGIGDTVIKQAVPPGGDLCIALGQVEACDLPKRGRLGCAIFGSGGLRSRVPRNMSNPQTNNGSIVVLVLILCDVNISLDPQAPSLPACNIGNREYPGLA